MTIPYRPSNGSEGRDFAEGFCEHCLHDHAFREGRSDVGCPLIVRAMVWETSDAAYPAEWICDDDGSNPRCTAFAEVSHAE